MTKEEMLSAIYDEMADKTLSDGCIIHAGGHKSMIGDAKYYGDCGFIPEHISVGWCSCCAKEYKELEYSIIWHPVLIGDVLKYIDTNCCFVDDGEWNKSRDMEALDSMLRAVFYSFVGKQNRPIEEQDESCIDYVFSLIK